MPWPLTALLSVALLLVSNTNRPLPVLLREDSLSAQVSKQNKTKKNKWKHNKYSDDTEKKNKKNMRT